MNEQTLKQRIALWKSMPVNSKGETDTFIDALIERIKELESEVENLGYEISEAGEWE